MCGASPVVMAGGELSARSMKPGLGDHGESLGRSHGEAAGVELGASPVNRMTVNVGTIRDRSPLNFFLLPAREIEGIGATSAEGAGGAEPS